MKYFKSSILSNTGIKYYGTTVNNETRTGMLVHKGDITSIIADMGGNQYIVRTNTLKAVPVKG